MANVLAGIVEDEQVMEKVISQNLEPEAKRTLVKSMRAQSFQDAKKANSLQTILSISNTMVGSSTLVFPVLYQNSGIFGAIIIALVFAVISCKTSQLLVIHNKKDELDLQESLTRVLGVRWNQIFGASNILLLYFANVVYFILMCSLFYAIVQVICEKLDIPTSDQNTISFDKISFQYIGCIYMTILLPLFLMKDLRYILKILQFGSISVICYVLFIVFKAIENLSTNFSACTSKLNWFGFDLITIAGVFAVAFNIQAAIIPIIKNSEDITKSKRDIMLGFGWTWLIYTFIGSFGATAISSINSRPGTNGATVLDFMQKDDIFTLIVEVLILLQLTSVSPVLQFITRSQFFGILYELQSPPKWQYYGYTIFYALSTLFLQICNINVSLILSLAGALIGFFQVFLIPILLHLACLYPRKNKAKVISSRPSCFTGNMNSNTYSSDGLLENPDIGYLAQDEEDLKCNNHEADLQQYSKSTRYLIYFTIIAIGITIAILSVIMIIKSKI